MTINATPNLIDLIYKRPLNVAQELNIHIKGDVKIIIAACLAKIEELGLNPEKINCGSPKLRPIAEGSSLKKVASVTKGLNMMSIAS